MRVMGSDEEQQMKLRPLVRLPARPLLTSCCAARFLTGRGPVGWGPLAQRLPTCSLLYKSPQWLPGAFSLTYKALHDLIPANFLASPLAPWFQLLAVTQTQVLTRFCVFVEALPPAS